MRHAILAAGLFAAALGLSACNSKSDDAATTAAPAAPPKDLARSQSMYQGEELIQKVDTASIKVGKGGLEMQAAGSAAMPGYTKASFLPRINPFPPKDGIYEVDVVAEKPASGAPAATPIDVKGAWDTYPKDHLKGVKFMTKTNSVVAMLPAG